MLLLQKAETLPEKTRFTDAMTGGDSLADAPAQRVIMVVRFKAPLRPRSAGKLGVCSCTGNGVNAINYNDSATKHAQRSHGGHHHNPVVDSHAATADMM